MGINHGLTAALLGFLFAGTAGAQETAWPRQREVNGNTIVMYQPQVDAWENEELLSFRSAIAVKRAGEDQPVLGVITAQAKTKVSMAERSVLLTDPQVQVHFPDLQASAIGDLEQIVREALPNRQTMVVDLDRILSYVSRSEVQAKEIAVNLEPPPIFYSDKPAILVIFMGEPRFKPAPGTNLLFAANTNWDVFLDTSSSRYFLLNGDSWLTSSDPWSAAWNVATELPADMAKLPNDENWAEVRKHLHVKPDAVAPAVFVSAGPAELIITEGEAEMTPIPGAKLLFVTNTDSDLFFRTEDRKFYYLVAGRWFRSDSLKGPWEAATTNLPPDFAQIPDDSAKANVLASVPGTPEAEEAVIQASIPQKATVTRSEAKVEVAYGGAPQFKLIDGSDGVSYATNTTFTVLMVGSQYYCCEAGVWFVAPQPTGPWVVCSEVPKAIYSIPPSSPQHNVTYVYVYDSDAEQVTVGYTSGYSGAYVANGLVMFGAGVLVGAALDDDWYAWHSSPCYYSYGCHAHYDYHAGGFVRTGHYYGPYGGAGYGARYNPVTGGYARGAYAYGPYGSAGVGSAYNPATGRYARGGYVSGQRGTIAGGSTFNPNTGRGAATRQVDTPYGSWGRSVVSDGDDWARFGHHSGEHGKTAGFETSEGAKGVVHKGDDGWKYVGKSKDGDVYAGGDGRVYRRDESNQWQGHSNTSRNWNTTEQKSYTKDQSRTRPDQWDQVNQRNTTQGGSGGNRGDARESTAGTRQQSRSAGSSKKELNRDAWSRDRGAKLSSRDRSASRGGRSRGRGRP